MIGLVVVTVLMARLVLSTLAAVACTAVVRDGAEEDRVRGYLTYRS